MLTFILLLLLLPLLNPSANHSTSRCPLAAIEADTSSTVLLAPLAIQRPADGITHFIMRLRQRGSDSVRVLGTMRVSQAKLDTMGQHVVRRVIVYDYGAKGRVIDTTLSVARTLAPILERTIKSTGTIRLDFSGNLITGALTSADSVRPIRDTLPAPAFNSTDVDYVIRSLELRDSLHITLPIYDPEMGGFRYAELWVQLGAAVVTTGGKRSAWLVQVRDRNLRAIYRVDRESRALLTVSIELLEKGLRYLILRDDVSLAFSAFF